MIYSYFVYLLKSETKLKAYQNNLKYWIYNLSYYNELLSAVKMIYFINFI